MNQICKNYIRYQPIIDDWDAFITACKTPMPQSVWTNTSRLSSKQLQALLDEAQIHNTRSPWYPTAFRLNADFKPGQSWMYLAGLYHIQEEISLLPVLLLDPQPGERILDLCAAPGGKTAQMALSMENTGTIVANDRNRIRLFALNYALNRLGIHNVCTTRFDGTSLPKAIGLFDRILVDAPCTCEGTLRKNPEVIDKILRANYEKQNAIQKALLRKAVRLCKPGGRIVYSTCTFAPEENESVVHAILDESGHDSLKIIPANIQHLKYSPGLTAWQDQTFHPSLQNSIRVWPHQNDTGGFFCAVLEKKEDLEQAKKSGLKQNTFQIKADEINPSLIFLKERFGIQLDVNALGFHLLHKDGLSLISKDFDPPEEPKPLTQGHFILRTHPLYPKASTSGAMWMSKQVQKNRIELQPQQLQKYLHRQEVIVEPHQLQNYTGTGYVMVAFKGFVMGMGFFKEENNFILSLYPKRPLSETLI